MYDQMTSSQNFITYQPEYIEVCLQAKEFEDAGDYESAITVLGDLWQGIGEKPNLEEFPDLVKAEVLIRIGALTGWLGSSAQIEGSQEKAKDLIGEGIRIFEDLADKEKIAEALSDLGVCYWREGAFPEAQNFLEEALEKVPAESYALRGKILLRLVNVAISKRKYKKAVSLLKKAEPLINLEGDDLLIGKLYFHQGLVSILLFEEEGSKDFAEVAAKHYQKASYHYRRANHQRYEAIVENNLGFLYLSINDFENAHEHLDNSINLFSVFNDSGRLASVFDTKARVYLEEKKFIEAELFAQKSVQLFMGGDEYFSLAESLTTLGTVFARQGSYGDAKESFEKAIEAANYVNDPVNAGLAMITQIEELQAILSVEEKKELYKKASKLLSATNRALIQKRLVNAEQICLNQTSSSKWENFSLNEEVLKFEAGFITQALKETNGAVTKAATLLGLSHQHLSLLLKTRHIALASIKKPRKKRSDRKRKPRAKKT